MGKSTWRKGSKCDKESDIIAIVANAIRHWNDKPPKIYIKEEIVRV